VAKDAATQEACRSAAVQDEQGNNATFARWRTNVQGGGIIYTINAVSAASPCSQHQRVSGEQPQLIRH
jgi:hypothetical protein